MTPRERLAACLNGEIPDAVPVAPDISNMVPARLTGKPFWDLYLYNDPPIWEAYIEAAKYFGIDSLMDGYFWLDFPDEGSDEPEKEVFVVHKDERRIITQRSWLARGARCWEPLVTVYHVGDPPNESIRPAIVGLPSVPEKFEPLRGAKPVDHGPEGLQRVKELMGDRGLVGVWLTSSLVLHNEEMIYDYYDNPKKYDVIAEDRITQVERRFEQIMALRVKPDFLCVGASGTFVFQTEEIFRTVALPAVKRGIELASSAGFPTHMHSCGPQARLVEIMAEETDLTVIDPLEIPPMGDCDLQELKARFGHKLVLKGNLHTTSVMLDGSVDEVVAASKQAIDDAAAGGRFILSTGDQCGRDTPEENLFALVETARSYGRY